MHNQKCSSGRPGTATSLALQVGFLCTRTAVLNSLCETVLQAHAGETAGHLSTDAVLASSAHVMETTMDYMIDKWGSASGYAKAIGITSTEISSIRMNFMKDAAPKDLMSRLTHT